MKIIIEDKEALAKQYNSWDQLTNEYMSEESRRGRKVPSYAWETIALAVAGYLLQKAADEIIKYFQERKAKAAEKAEKEKQNALEEARQQKLLESLEQLRQVQLQGDKQQNTMSLLEWARENNVPIRILLETESEQDLLDAFEKIKEENKAGFVEIKNLR